MDYQNAKETIGLRNSVRVKPNTYLIRLEENVLGIRLYDTTIITYYPDGKVSLSVGCWETKHSRDRINDFLNRGRIYLRDGRMYVSYGEYIYLFENNMNLFPDGTSDAKRIEVEDFEYIGYTVDTIEDVIKVIEGSTIKALRKIWRRCKYSRRLIAYYATLDFIPLIITENSNESWFQVVKERLATG